MCDCFHLAFPNWHAASSGTGAGRRPRGAEPVKDDDSICDEPSQFTEGERPRPQGSSPVEEFPETEKYTDSDKECEAEHDPPQKRGKKTKKSGFGSRFDKHSTPKMSKLKEVPSPESGVIVKTAKDGCAEGLIYGGGGKEGIFIKDVVPESPASKSLKLKQGDQVLSATVYFDNVSYEDAIQILEHAQAYKVKLCLKRNPDVTETEPAVESDVIPEEELYSTEMSEQGKTKKRNDTRISWPKFPSFGKGRKSRFTRSHSSSEAEEQKKLELSPTASYTESPIKSQDALKGKKKHKLKLSVLTKKSRVSSTEEQDADAPTTGQVSGVDIHQTQEALDMPSPDRLESPPGETPDAYATEVLTVVQDSDLRLEQNQQKLTEPQTVQHKAELIAVDSTLKTTDLTVALAGQESPSGVKSPDGKKKKKEKSELKMKILGKDKSKKDAKAKSPKRLKTLGASIEKTEPPKTEKADVITALESQTELQGDQLALDTNAQIISKESPAKSVTTPMKISVPQVELDISDIALIKKSQQKGEEKTKKGKGIKEKQETKTGPTFKLPQITLGDIATEETIQKMNVDVEEYTTKIEQFTTEGKDVKEDAYDKLSKSGLSRAELPKREDIEIPGMEDVSKKTTTKGIKVPKVVSTGSHEEIQPETVQLSIDVDSVKEAVSKLPGFKLPKVDSTGVPIPEEITVIDANAQRISVKTPTKVVDTKAKHEAHFTKFDVTASPEISKSPIKLPKIKPGDLTSEELISETKVDFKKDVTEEAAIYQTQEIERTEGAEGIKSEYQLTAALISKESDKKSKKSKIVMPSFGITKPDIKIPNIGIDLPKQNISEQKYDKVKGERTTGKDKKRIVGVMSDIKIPEIKTSAMTFEGELEAPSDNTEYSDSSAKKDGGIRLTGFGVNLDTAQAKAVSFSEIGGEVKDIETEEHTIKLHKFGTVIPDTSVNVPDAAKDVHIDGAEIKTPEKEGKSSKFKVPNLGISMPKVKGPKMDLSRSKKDIDVRLPEAPEFDVTFGSEDVSIPEQKLEVKRPELEIKPLKSEGDLDGQGSKFKMPKFGIKIPKMKGPEFDLSLSKKDTDVTLPEAKGEVELPEAPDVDITLGSVDVSIPGQNLEVKKPELEIKPLKSEGELDGQGSKFKIRKFGIKIPKIKGPEFDLSLSKKDIDVPVAKGGVKFPEAPDTDVTLGSVDVSIPEQKLGVKKPELEIKPLKSEGELEGQGSKFKIPKFGIKIPKVKGPEFDLSLSKKDIDVPEATAEVKFPEAPDTDITLGSVDVSIPEQKLGVKKPELEIQPLKSEGDLDGQGSKFKIPKFGIKIPKMKGPEFDLSLSKKDIDVPVAKGGVKFPEAPDTDVTLGSVDVSIPEQKLGVKKPELEIHPLKSEGDLDGQGSKFKMPKLGIKMPKIKGPEFDLSLSKKDVHVSEATAEVKFPEAPKIDVTQGNIDMSIPEQKMEVEKPQLEIKSLEIEGKPDGQGSKFKMPKLGIAMPKVKGPEIDFSISKKDIDVTLPEAKAEVSLPDVELKEPSAEVEIKAPEFKGAGKSPEGSPSKFKMPTFKLPKFGTTTPNVSVEISDKNKDIQIPETQLKTPKDGGIVGITAPDIDIESPSFDVKTTAAELDGKGSKFKMPKFGISLPKVKGPEIDLSLSKKDVDVTLPEAKSEVKFPDVEHTEFKVKDKAPEIDVHYQQDVEGSPSKFKMPTFKLPKFGVGTPNISAEVSDIDKDAKIYGTDINIPGEGLATPSIDIESPSIDMKTTVTEHDGKESKFKMPHLGFSMPKVKGQKIDLSLSKKDVEFTLPEAKADVKIPEAPKIDVTLGKVDVSTPEAKMEVKKPELEMPDLQIEGQLDGQGDKLKMRKIKAPEFDLSLSMKDIDVTLPEMKAEGKLPDAPKIDVSLGKAKVLIPEAKVEVEKPELKIKHTEVELEGQGSKFKMPKFGVSMPKVKVPELDLSLSKKDKNVTLPDNKVAVELPEAPKIAVDMKPPESEADVDKHGSKFKMPKFGITMPKVKGPEIDLSFTKKDGDVSLPEATAEVKLPDVELKEPSAEVEIKAPAIDKGIKVEGGELKIPKDGATADVATPSINIASPSLDVKMTGTEGEGKEAPQSKFKMPKFGVSLPKVKGPEIDLSLSKKDVDDILPEANAEVNLPDVELKQSSAKVEVKAPEIEAQLSSVKGPPSKFKLPSFKFPKFGAATPTVSVEVPDTDKEIKIDGADMDVSVPQKDIDVPEVKAGIDLPEVEVKGSVVMEQQPEVEGDAKLKKSRFSLSGFSFSRPSVKAPEADVSAQSVNAAIPEGKVELTGGEVDMKPPECEAEIEKQGSKFKMPKFGITTPKVTGPESDLSLSKKDVDVILPEAKVDVKHPEVKVKESSAEVEIKAPEIKVATKQTEGSPSKFKMPSFKLPKFGAATPKVTVEVPDVNKDIKIGGEKLEVEVPDVNKDIKISGEKLEVPKEGATVDVTAPSIDTEGLSVDVKAKGGELEGSASKFKLPKFDISMPKVKIPEIDLSLSKKDGDVTLPEAEVQLPDVKMQQLPAKTEIEAPETEAKTVNVEGPHSELKMPTFTLPKFGAATPKVSVEVPDVNKDIKISGEKLEVPKEGTTVDVTAPSIDTEGLSVDVKAKGSELEGSGSKFKLPKFDISMPKVKIPEIDLSLSKKDIDVPLPEAKAEVKLPDVEVNKPEAAISAPDAPDIAGIPSATIEVPGMGKDIKIDGADIKIPEEVLAVNIAAPSVDTKGPSMDVKLTGPEHEGKGSKFKMPSLGFSIPQVKGRDIDLSLSKKDVDVTLPEAKAEVQLPDVEVKEPSAKVEIEAPGIDIQTSNIEGSPSKLKTPTLKLPTLGAATPQVSVEVPDVDKDIKVDGADLTLPEVKAEVKIPDAKLKKSRFSFPKFSFSKQSTKQPEVDVSLPEVDVSLPEGNVEVKQPEVELKQGPEINLSLSKKDGDVTLPEAEVQLPDVKMQQLPAKIEIEAPETEAKTVKVERSPSELKMPTFTLPKFGAATPKVSVEVPDVNKDIKIGGVKLEVEVPDVNKDIKIGGEKLGVEVPDVNKDIKIGGEKITAPSIDTEGLSVDVKAKGSELEGSGSKFKLPKFDISMPKVKIPEIDLSLSKKDIDVTLPEAKAEVKLPDVEVNKPEAAFSVPDAPDIAGIPSATIEVPDMDKDIKIDGVDIKFPKDVLAVNIAAPSVDIEGQSMDVKLTGTEHERKGSKFKLPSLGFSMPQVKGPDIDLSLSKKDVDVTLPEAKAEVKLPDIEVKEPSPKVEIEAPGIDIQTSNIEGSPSKLKTPTLKLPTLGAATPQVSVEVPDVDKDIKVDGADLTLPEVKAEVKIPDAKLKKSRFSFPKFSFSKQSTKQPEVDVSLPEVDVSLPEGNVEVKQPEVELKQGPEINLSLSKKDGDVTLPEAEVQLPDVKMQQPPAKIEIEVPETEAKTVKVERSPSELKMPTFTLPKFGAATPKVSVEVPDVNKDIKIGGVKLEVEVPDVNKDIKIGGEKLGVEVPDVNKDIKIGGEKITAPSIDTESLSVDVKAKGSELEGSASKFKLPKFDISMPKVKLPEIDLSLSKKDIDVTLPEAKAEVKLPDVEVNKPEAAVSVPDAPDIAGTPSATIEVPDMDKDIKIDGADIKIPEKVLGVNIAAPSIDIGGPSIDVKLTGTEHEGKGSKFKLPSLGFSMPQVKGPDIDLSLSKKDVDVTLPEAKAEVQLPDVEVKEPSAKVEIEAPGIDIQTSNTERSPSKLKMPTLKLPTLGAATPQVSVEVPDVDKDIKVDGADLTLPEAKADIKIPDVEIQKPTGSIQEPITEGDAKLRKPSWTLPRFSFSKTSIKPVEAEVNLDVPKVDVTLPETKTDVHLPDIDIKQSSDISIEGAPATDPDATPQVSVEVPDVDKDIKVDGADLTLPEAKAEVKIPDAKLKKTRFSLPKFSFSKQSAKESEVDASLPEVDVSLPEGNVEVKQPEVELKPPEGDAELDGQESKFKMFGISMPKVKGPEAEVQLPDVKMKQTSAEMEIKAPETEVQTGNVEGSPSKLKMPTFTLPKFGAATPKVSVEAPDVNKDIKIDDAKLEVPKEGSGSIFKMPRFGISTPKVKEPETDLSLSKKDGDVTLPGAKVKLTDVKLKQTSAKTEVKAPETEVQTGNVEGSPSKLKMPTFTLPKFGAATPKVSVEAPDVNKDIKIDEAKLEAPKEGSGSMFKMPRFGISTPKVKEPETDLSLSKKDGDVTLPGAKFQLPGLKMKQTSAKTEIKAPETEVQTGNVEGSPSKLKMPTFTLPKFGAATPETPDVNKDIKIDEAKLEAPKEGSGSMFKMPRFGISTPKVKEPETDLSLSKKDGDVTLPGAKFQLPGLKMKQTSAKTEIKAPETEVQTGNVEGSPSKLKMPTFTLPKFGAATPKVSVEAPDVNKDIKIDETKVEAPKEGSGSMFKMPRFGISMPKGKEPETDLSLSKKDGDVTLPGAKVKLTDVKMKQPSAKTEIKAPETEAQTGNVEGSPSKLKMPTFTLPKFGAATPKVSEEAPDVNKDIKIDETKLEAPKEGSGSMFKMPRFSISMSKGKEPEDDLSLSKKDVPVPEAKAEVKQPDVEVNEPEVPDASVEDEAKLKRPSWAFPRFSFSKTGGKSPDVDVNLETPKVDVTSPELKAEVSVPDLEIKGPSMAISTEEPPAEELDANLKKPRFSLPRFSFSKASVKEPEVSADLPHVDVSVPEGEVKVKEPEMEIKDPELEAEHDGQGSKLKLPSVDIKMDVSKVAVSDSETPKAETDSVGLDSQSKFKLPLFKMPKLNFSRPKTEDEYVSADAECKDNQLEMETEPKEEGKSPKMTLTSFGEILKNIDVEFDVPKTDKEEENLDTSKEVHETAELKKQEAKGKETNAKQDTTKSSERTGWFKFPKFGLSSPSEPAKVSEKDEHKDEKSPVGETVDEEISPTLSVQSSDAFADVSSTMTSEHVGLSLSSPTKVTVKYSDPNFTMGLGEMHSNIITSTTRTELISVEPNLPEKITILSSGLSSSSEDTLRLESGKIHVITSNIQATPETQQAKILTAVQVQSTGGLPLQSESKESASWSVENTQSGRRSVFEKLLVRQTSSESKETIVKTKQTTHIFDSTEPISDETATSIQRLRDSVHSEKMRFFDGAKK